MIILNGVKYRLTRRGKIAVSCLLVAFVAILLLVSINSNKHAPIETSKSSVQPLPATTVKPKSLSSTSAISKPNDFVIFFDPDSTTLSSTYEKPLDLIAAYLKATPTAEILIEGNYNAYPDLKGSYFEELSMERAMNVSGYLMQLRDVPTEQIKVVNLGGKKQINKDTSKAELAKNRRVDISIISKKQD